MKIGIVGYQGCGKSTLFHWLTGIEPDPARAHETQAAMATVPDPRLFQLRDIYNPKKLTQAAVEMVDTPGLSRSHEGSAAKLAMIREAGCLVVVVAAYGGADPAADLSNFEDDLLIADLSIVSGRVERLREQVKKPRPNRDELQKELAALEPILEALESGQTVRELELSPEQQRVIRSFQLFSDKPRFLVINTDDDEAEPQRLAALAPEGTEAVAVSLSLQVELSGMEQEERDEFCQEMGVAPFDRDELLRQIMTASGQMLFFTAGEKEVRSWLIRRGGTAVEAADGIHSDLARGFIRAEVMKCEDLIRLGSEREVKAQNLLTKEHKEYVLQDGDIVLIQHN
jgi:GTP-binding protein YchF